MSQHEFMAGVQALRAWSVQPQQAKQYTSQKQMVADKKQHRRVEWNAQQALQEPITAAQTVSTRPSKLSVAVCALLQQPLTESCKLCFEGSGPLRLLGR